MQQLNPWLCRGSLNWDKISATYGKIEYGANTDHSWDMGLSGSQVSHNFFGQIIPVQQ